MALPPANGQDAPGYPPIRYYSPQEYGSHRQNWAITQAPDGTMFFANGKGVLLYDGENWTLLLLPNRGHVRSIAAGPDSLVYIGGNGDLGIVRRRADGSPEYESWLARIPEEDRAFGRVRTTIATGREVWFQANYRIFRWKDGEQKIWRFENLAHRLFRIDNKIYLSKPDEGLLELNEQDEFVPVRNGSLLKENRVHSMLPYRGKFLLATRSQGMLIYDGKGLTPFQTELDDLLDQDYVDAMTYLPGNKIALAGTRSGGLIVIDAEGRLVNIYEAASGIGSDNVLNVYLDRNHGLWVALQEGVARIEMGSPFSIFDDRLGLGGSVQSIHRHGGALYAGTSLGVAKMVRGTHRAEFMIVSSGSSYVWDINSWRDRLLVGKTHGLYEYTNDIGRKIMGFDHLVAAVKPSAYDASVISFVTDDGFAQARFVDGAWELLGRIEGLRGAIRDFIEMEPGVFWLKSRSNGLFRLTFPVTSFNSLNFNEVQIDRFGFEKGVPIGENNLFRVDDDLLVMSEENRLYRWDAEASEFLHYPDFSLHFGIEKAYVVPKTSENAQGEIWLDRIEKDNKVLLKAERGISGNFEVRRFPLSRKIELFTDILSNEVFHADGNNVWYTGMHGIIQYNLLQKAAEPVDFSCFISRVYVGDSLLRQHQSSAATNSVIAYRDNDLVFEFSSPLYQEEDLKEYQYRLLGFDEDWSNWSAGTRKEYTNLREGQYTFELRARNGFGEAGLPAYYQFAVQPPWYRTWAAYLLYGLGALLLVSGISYWRSRSLQAENVRLESIVEKRTQQISKQAEELRELNEVKSRFFANISHELRTPLTLILGPVKDLLGMEQGEREQQRLRIIHNNTKRLLRLINQLLDLSRIEEGKLDLKAAQGNFVPFLHGLVMSFESFARQKNTTLHFIASDDPILLYYDPDKMEQVVVNLLANALKFTPDGGVVTTSVDREGNRVVVRVKDTGIGIHAEQLPHIFDRFYQADNSDTRAFEGTGIGLALTKDLVELHGGSIAVESTYGKGTVFTVYLQTGSAHLDKKQLVSLMSEKTNSPHQDLEATIPTGIGPTAKKGQAQQVLIVDDNREMREYIRLQLEEEFSLLEAGDGEEGWEQALQYTPDLIISDVMMPRVGGYDLCKRLKNDVRTSHIPVILLTAKAGIDEKLKGLSLHADDYLVKPFHAKELKLRISNLIASRRQLQKRFAEKVLFQPRDVAVDSQEEVFLNRLIETVEKHLDDTGFGVQEFSRALGLSRSQLNRKMQALLNRSPNQFLRSYRLAKARLMIEQNTGTISEISYDVGFSSPAYFSKCFQEEFGVTPKEIRKASRK